MRRRLAYWLFGDVIREACVERERFVRGRIHDDGWWFSHDEPTMHVIQALALGQNVADVREKWHKATGKHWPPFPAEQRGAAEAGGT